MGQSFFDCDSRNEQTTNRRQLEGEPGNKDAPRVAWNVDRKHRSRVRALEVESHSFFRCSMKTSRGLDVAEG